MARSFAELEYEGKKKKTRRERFLERMEKLIPWGRLVEEIRPYYPRAGKGRRVPDETTILNFRHLLERHGLGNVLFETIKEHLAEQGLMLKKARRGSSCLGRCGVSGDREAPRP